MVESGRSRGSRRRRSAASSGQASVELIAAIPFLILATLVAIQLALIGFALWSAGSAARAGARSSYVGGIAESAARAALPGPLRRGAEVEAPAGGPVEVEVRAPSLVPGVPGLSLAASAGLGVGEGDGG